MVVVFFLVSFNVPSQHQKMDYLVCNYSAHKKNLYMWWIILFENPKQNIKKNYGPCLPISFGHLKFAQPLPNLTTHLFLKLVGRNHILKNQFKPKIVKQNNNVIKQGWNAIGILIWCFAWLVFLMLNLLICSFQLPFQLP